MSSRQDEKLKSRSSGLVPHSVPAPSALISFPTSPIAPLAPILPIPICAPVSTSLREQRLASIIPKMPPLTNCCHQDRREVEQTTQPQKWPSYRPLSNPDERLESAATASRYGPSILSNYPHISSANVLHESGTRFLGCGLTPYTEKHSHAFAHSDTRMPLQTLNSRDFDPHHGSCTRFPAPAAIPAFQNGHMSTTPRMNSNQSGSTPNIVPTLSGLVSDVISHPFLPLMIKKVFEVCTQQEVVISNCTTQLSNIDNDACKLSNFILDRDVEEGCAQRSPLDVFLAAVLCSLEDLKKRPTSLHIPWALRDTITACGDLVMANSHCQQTYPSTDVPHQSYGVDHGRLASHQHSVPTYEPIKSDMTPGPRPMLSPEARQTLEEWFQRNYNNPYPTDEEKHALAQQCGIRLNQVKNFFGNKRMRIKRKAMAISQSNQTARRYSENVDPSSVLAPRAKWSAMVLSKIPNVLDNAYTDGGSKEKGVGQTCEAPLKLARYE